MDQRTSVDRYDRDVLSPGQTTLVTWAAGASRVLEFGPSTGYMSQAMRDVGCHVTAVEIDHSALGALAHRADRALWGDLEQPASLADLEDQSFDVLVLADVLEHLRDPRTALHGLIKLLAPGGRVLVSMPNVAFWRVRLELLRGSWEMTDSGIMDETHLRFFTRSSAEQMFTTAGFTVEHAEDVWSEVPFDNRVKSTLPRLWPVKDRLNQAVQRRHPGLFAYQYLWRLRPDTDQRPSP